MKKMIMTFVALIGAALLTASFATADKPDKPVEVKNQAAKQCAALKNADKAAFKSLYGPKRAMRTCIKGERDESRSELKNAAKDCKAEKAADPVAFEETYGAASNAHGKCVSSKVKAEDAEDTQQFKNAAKACKAERAEDPDGFKATYGSVKSKGKNALGKCVSQKVQEDAETV